MYRRYTKNTAYFIRALFYFSTTPNHLKSIQVFGSRSSRILVSSTSSMFAFPWITQFKRTTVCRLWVLGLIQGIHIIHFSFLKNLFTIDVISSSKANENIQGTARVINPELGAKLLVTFSSSAIDPSILTIGNFWVLETDYLNYAVVFLCVPVDQNGSLRKFFYWDLYFILKSMLVFLVFLLEFLSYLSRVRFPFMTGLDFVRQRIESLGLDRRFLKPNNQLNCPTTS